MKPVLYGPDNRPIERATLSAPLALPEPVGPRAVHAEAVAAGLSPERLARILRAATIGDARAYLTLAEEMEERYLHYASQVQTRRLAIEGIEPSVEAPDGVPAAIVDFARALVEDAGFRDVCGALTDGIAKGYAVAELIWDVVGGRLVPVAYVWRDPRFFVFDRLSMTELRLATTASLEGEPLPPGKFVVHMPRAKTGVPLRRGFARAAAWAFLLQGFTVKDWAAFCEVYGMPIRVGKYHPGASEADRRALLHAVRSIANDAAAIVPQGMDLEFHEVAGQRGEAVFGGLLGYLDRNVSKLVVGQTMTADDGASLAQAKVHNEVRLDIVRADGRQLGHTLTRDAIMVAVALNFGPQAVYPRVTFPVAEPEDVEALSAALGKLVPLGLKVGQREVRDKLGLSEPAAGEAVLIPPAPRQAQDDEVAAPAPKLPGRSRPSKTAVDGLSPRRLGGHHGGCRCPACAAPATGRLSAELAAEIDTAAEREALLDALVSDALDDWQPIEEALIGPVRTLLASAASLEEARAALERLARDVDGGPLARRLARATAIARGLGDVED